MGTSLVEKFAQSAIEVPYRPKEEIKAELVAVTSARASLYSVEAHEAKKLDARAHRLRRDLQFAGTTYKRLSLEPLTWRKGYPGYPAFAMYSLFEPAMILRSPFSNTVRNGRANAIEPSLPEGLRKVYDNHTRLLAQDRIIASTFQGVIPRNVREAIEVAKPFFTEESYASPKVYIIGEADWVESAEPRPIRRFDPLVVGWDGSDLWLIAHFDLTPLERYVVEEFPALPEHTDSMRLPGIVEKEI